MRKTVHVLVSTLLVALLAGCGSDEPTIEQENPNYRHFISDDDSTGDSRTRPDEDVHSRPLDDAGFPGNDVASQPDGVSAPDTTNPGLDVVTADVGCVPGTKCYEAEYKIMGSMVSVILDGQAFNPEYFLFDLLPPASKTITFTIKSNGFNQLNLVDAFLAPGGNPAIWMTWDTPGLPADLPVVLQPGESVSGKITYQPDASTPGTPSHFTIWSSDPDHLERVVVLKPKEQGPDIELPISAVNFGCGSYCFGQEFSIENAGNQDLIIQSTSFQKAGEWIATAVPAPGTVLKPAGSPGYAPIPITLDYCDGDGNYSNDSNVFQIFTNDPDENPANIYLNVMLPDECP